jgi:tetratricopeptide (TPR) repeat protein
VEQERSRSLDLARHYLEIGRPDQALDTLSQGDIDPTDPELMELRAHAFFDSGRYKKAADTAREGLALEPQAVGLLETLALAETQLEHHEQAQQANAKALELSPWNPVLHAQRGLILARRSRYDEARSAVDEALGLAPDLPYVLQIRAQVETLAGDHVRAQKAIDDLLRADPENRVAHALKGGLAADNENIVEAAKHFDAAARLDPNDPDVAEAARELRVLSHPVLKPVRGMWRVGRWRSWFLYLTVISVLAAAQLDSIRVVVAVCWLTIVALSWFGPPVLRRLQARRYGR